MATTKTTTITEYTVINIPFNLNEDGTLTTTLSIDQYNTLNKYIISHQKRLDTATQVMARKSGGTATPRPKTRYQFIVTNPPQNIPQQL